MENEDLSRQLRLIRGDNKPPEGKKYIPFLQFRLKTNCKPKVVNGVYQFECAELTRNYSGSWILHYRSKTKRGLIYKGIDVIRAVKLLKAQKLI